MDTCAQVPQRVFIDLLEGLSATSGLQGDLAVLHRLTGQVDLGAALPMLKRPLPCKRSGKLVQLPVQNEIPREGRWGHAQSVGNHLRRAVRMTHLGVGGQSTRLDTQIRLSNERGGDEECSQQNEIVQFRNVPTRELSVVSNRLRFARPAGQAWPSVTGRPPSGRCAAPGPW